MNNFMDFLNIIKEYWGAFMTLISIFVAFISIFYKVKSNFTSLISSFIKDAEEDTTLSNPEKMDMVISWIKDLIPRLFRVIFNDKVLRIIAENIYQDMKAYRNAYIKNKTGLGLTELVEVVESSKENVDDGK